MNICTDHHFVIGLGHQSNGLPCQDHVLSGLMPNYKGSALDRAFAVVSDGCSSGGNTDIGARIITTTTIRAMRLMLPITEETGSEDPERIFRCSYGLAETAQMSLGVDQSDLLATQLFAVVEPSGRAFGSVYGDGAIATVDRDGVIYLTTYEWEQNTPFYPHQSRRAFIEAHGGLENLSLKQKNFKLNPDGEIVDATEMDMTTEEGMNGITFFTDLKKSNMRLLCLFTDGIMQIDRVTTGEDGRKIIDRIPFTDVVRDLVAFKNLSGEFVRRRLIRFLAGDKRRGIEIRTLDDLGYAVIAID